MSAEHDEFIDIVFDGPPGHESGRFVEVEDRLGRGVAFGEWIDRGNGYWVLRIARHPGAGFELRKHADISQLRQAAAAVLLDVTKMLKARDPKWDGSYPPDTALGKLTAALDREGTAA